VIEGGTEFYGSAIQFSLARLSCAMVFGAMLRDTPDHVPYWGGSTFYPILFKPIPRLVYPDKPVERTDLAVGHRYGFVAGEDFWSTFHLPMLIELYLNFGVIGVLLGMTLYGMIYRAAMQVFVHPGMGLGGVIATAYISSAFLVLASIASAIESNASEVLGQVFWSFIFVAVVHLVVQSGDLRAGSAKAVSVPPDAVRLAPREQG